MMARKVLSGSRHCGGIVLAPVARAKSMSWAIYIKAPNANSPQKRFNSSESLTSEATPSSRFGPTATCPAYSLGTICVPWRRTKNNSVHFMKIRLIFRLWFFVFCGFQASAAEPSKSSRPNILYIMSDDHAAHAMSCYGSVVNETPNMDRIAKEGMRLDRCYVVNSICTPSRATILTGKYSHINGVTVFNRFDGSQPTVAKMLQKAGYHTGMIGKWHLFSDPTGFDYWNILPGQGKYHDPDFIEMGNKKVM